MMFLDRKGVYSVSLSATGFLLNAAERNMPYDVFMACDVAYFAAFIALTKLLWGDIRQRFWSSLVWLDCWVNDYLLRGRWETISGRCHRRTAKGCIFCTWLCKALNKIDPGHCKRAYFGDRLKNPGLPWV